MLLLTVPVLTSCASLQNPPLVLSQDQPLTGAPFTVVATWKNHVYYAPDPARGGAPTPGLVGRIYMFGKEPSHPIAGQGGGIVVDLYDCSHVAAGGQPALLEEWRIDPATLQRLLHKDGFGWGYTLFLPWGTHRPDLRNVQLRARYEAPGAWPLYAAISQVTLQDEVKQTPMVRTVPMTQPTMPVTPPPAGRPLEAPRLNVAGEGPRPHGLTMTPEPPRSQSFNLARTPEAPGAVQPGAYRP